MARTAPKHLTLLLSPMVIAIAISMDIYIPALPHIGHLFHASPRMMQLSLNLFMLSCGITQLVYGPLSDCLGRKPVGMAAIAIFSLGSILCANAPNIDTLIAFRIIQAIGACGTCVIGFSVVRDFLQGIESAKSYSYLNGLIAFSPMFAPFIGSFLDIYLGWRSTFWALLLIPLAALFTFGLKTPESLAPEKRLPINKHLFQQYLNIFKNTQFFWYGFAAAAGLCYLFVFCSISPYLLIQDLHVPEKQYGFYFAFMGISYFMGSWLCARVVGHLGIFRTVYLGFIITLTGSIAMLLWYWLGGLSVSGFILPMLLIGMGGTCCMGAGSAGAMEPFSSNTGCAAALTGTYRFTFASVVGNIVIGNHIHSTLPLAIPAILFSSIGLLAFYWRRQALDFLEANTMRPHRSKTSVS